tara:strand:- start:361 stop:738 length:378 start_codon:yes stop_codon:yes gene_type:complete
MGLDQEMNSLSGDGKSYYWRKHARLQQFMAKQWEKQNPNKQPNGSFNLGFNGGDEPVKITKELLDEWQEQIEEKYFNYFATDGFFWGQQFQEEQVKEYKKQDQEACDWAKAMLERGESVVYTCSW